MNTSVNKLGKKWTVVKTFKTSAKDQTNHARAHKTGGHFTDRTLWFTFHVRASRAADKFTFHALHHARFCKIYRPSHRELSLTRTMVMIIRDTAKTMLNVSTKSCIHWTSRYPWDDSRKITNILNPVFNTVSLLTNAFLYVMMVNTHDTSTERMVKEF